MNYHNFRNSLMKTGYVRSGFHHGCGETYDYYGDEDSAETRLIQRNESFSMGEEKYDRLCGPVVIVQPAKAR